MDNVSILTETRIGDEFRIRAKQHGMDARNLIIRHSSCFGTIQTDHGVKFPSRSSTHLTNHRILEASTPILMLANRSELSVLEGKWVRTQPVKVEEVRTSASEEKTDVRVKWD